MSNGFDHPYVSIGSSAESPVDLAVDASGSLFAVAAAAHPTENSSRAVRPEFASHFLTALVDEMSQGVMLVSPFGQVFHSNRASCDAMARSGALTVQHGQLQATAPEDHDALLAALVNAGKGERSLIRLCFRRESLLLSVVPPPSQPISVCQTDVRSPIALFFQRSAMCDAGAFLLFARNFGLTPTEQQVLTFLCRSMSTPDIADALNVAVSTVRSHVRSLCHKTACKGARELINQIATLPPTGYCPRLKMH